jgi:hypothetical protein
MCNSLFYVICHCIAVAIWYVVLCKKGRVDYLQLFLECWPVLPETGFKLYK